MCAIFGVLDYKGNLTAAQRLQMVKALSIAAEVRGTDATGIAFFQRDKLCIQKAAKPAHKMKYRIPAEARYIMGHTRMTTQGSAAKNQNNHPFAGKAGGKAFALAHNGVLTNDRMLRHSNKLPKTSIETDSYVAVQLIEQQNEVSPDSLRRMAEAVEGSFTFTILDQDDNLYFVKGSNPLTIYEYSELGVYLYASTTEILENAIEALDMGRILHKSQHPLQGDIIRIDRQGKTHYAQFASADPYIRPFYQPYGHVTQQEYVQALKTVAVFHGFDPEEIDRLLANGYTAEDVEDLIYCGRYL